MDPAEAEELMRMTTSVSSTFGKNASDNLRRETASWRHLRWTSGTTGDTRSMLNPHVLPWHRDSMFGPGPRRPLDHKPRACFRQVAVSAQGRGLPLALQPHGGSR